MRTIRTASVMVALLLTWSAPPANASEGNAEPDWLDVTMTTQGILEPMPDRAAPTIRQAHGTVMGNFEDEPWTWRASGAGSCTEIVIDLMAVYPPRPGDWASARSVAIADHPVRNFCLPGTRHFHGTGRLTGGGGSYAGSEGDFTFTGTVTGNGMATEETIRMVSTGRLRCYHVGSVDDRVEHHRH